MTTTTDTTMKTKAELKAELESFQQALNRTYCHMGEHIMTMKELESESVDFSHIAFEYDKLIKDASEIKAIMRDIRRDIITIMRQES